LKTHEPKQRFKVQAELWTEEKKNPDAVKAWQDNAAADKIRFEKETTAYKAKNDTESNVVDLSGDESNVVDLSGDDNGSNCDLFGSDSN